MAKCATGRICYVLKKVGTSTKSSSVSGTVVNLGSKKLSLYLSLHSPHPTFPSLPIPTGTANIILQRDAFPTGATKYLSPQA